MGVQKLYERSRFPVGSVVRQTLVAVRERLKRFGSGKDVSEYLHIDVTACEVYRCEFCAWTWFGPVGAVTIDRLSGETTQGWQASNNS